MPDVQTEIALGRPYENHTTYLLTLSKYDDISRNLWNFSKGYLSSLGFRNESFKLTTTPLTVPRVVGNGQMTIQNPWEEVMLTNPKVARLLVNYHKSVYNLHGVPAAAGISWRHIPSSVFTIFI